MLSLTSQDNPCKRASLVAQLVKSLPAVRDSWVWSLGHKDPLAKGKATHSSILDWRIPWTVQSMGSQRVRHDWAPFTFTFHVNWGLETNKMTSKISLGANNILHIEGLNTPEIPAGEAAVPPGQEGSLWPWFSLAPWQDQEPEEPWSWAHLVLAYNLAHLDWSLDFRPASGFRDPGIPRLSYHL